ncbi:MAG: magnesium transporter, partial [Candidatus Limnocylindria bacterium]
MSEMERLAESVTELLAAGREDRLAAALEAAHAADLAAVVRALPLADQVRVFRLLPPDEAGAVLSELDDPTARELLRALDETEVSRILERMPSDHVVEVVEELPKAEADKILDLMEEEKSEEVQELLEYREGSAGRLMSPDFVAVSDRANVGQAIEHIRKSRTGDDAFYAYVIDEHEHLVGLVPLHRLLTADPATPIHAIRNQDVESVTVDTDQEEVAQRVQRYDLVQIPVVDASHRLLGTISVDDVIDVIHEEATEDIQRLGGVGGDETVLDSPQAVLPKRLIWRLINLGTAVLAASVIGLFESSIQTLATL